MKDLKLQLIRRGLPMVYACEGGEKITESKKFLFSYIPEQDAIVLNKKHKNYEHYKDLLLIYLQFNDLQKKEFISMPRSMGMTFFDSINKVLRMRKKILRT